MLEQEPRFIRSHALPRVSTIAGVQILRFVAAAMVVVHHIQLELESARVALPAVNDRTHITWRVGVDVFFITSGFVMFHLTRKHFQLPGFPLRFLWRRVARVAPPYWFVTTAYLVIAYLAPGGVNDLDLTPWSIVCSYLFLPWPRSDGSLFPVFGLGWTLNYEMMFYALYALALCFPRRIGLWLLALTMSALVVAYALVPVHGFVAKFLSNPIVLEFLAGVGLGWLHERGLRFGSGTRVALFVSGCAALIAFHLAHCSSDEWRPIWAGLPCLLVFAAFTLGTDFDKQTRVVRWLSAGGDASYSLYLTHMFVIRALSLLWPKLGSDSTSLYFALAIGASLGVALGSYHLVELPLYRGMRALRARFGATTLRAPISSV